jgi:hypothetical protein
VAVMTRTTIVADQWHGSRPLWQDNHWIGRTNNGVAVQYNKWYRRFKKWFCELLPESPEMDVGEPLVHLAVWWFRQRMHY